MVSGSSDSPAASSAATSASEPTATSTTSEPTGESPSDTLVRVWRRATPRLLGVTTALTLLFFYVPVALVAYFSFAPTAQPTLPIEGVSFRWYRAVFADSRFVRGLATSVGVGVIAAVGGTALGTMAAHVIVRGRLSRRVRGAVALVVALPLFVPTIVVALGVGVFAGRIGLGFGLVPVVLGHLFWVLPFSTFLLAARFADLDARLTEAARTLGADDRTAFRTVTVPLLAPGLVASLLFCFALSFNEFLITYFLAGSGVTTMPLELFDNIRTARVSVLNAASTLVLVVSAVVAFVASVLEPPTRAE
jgi:spermidine/putrescine transport system permease protein